MTQTIFNRLSLSLTVEKMTVPVNSVLLTSALCTGLTRQRYHRMMAIAVQTNILGQYTAGT
jgi:hypothetical protein